MLCLISNQHCDVANLVTGIGVAVRFGDLVERVTAPDDGAQLPGVDQLLQIASTGFSARRLRGNPALPSTSTITSWTGPPPVKSCAV